jgi:hypothetical protein
MGAATIVKLLEEAFLWTTYGTSVRVILLAFCGFGHGQLWNRDTAKLAASLEAHNSKLEQRIIRSRTYF